MFDAQPSALAHRSLGRRRVAAQNLGCLAPSVRHLCSTGPGIASTSVRSGIFWNGRKMSLLTELVSHRTYNTTYMPALTGFRLSGKSGQIWPKIKRQAKIKPNQTKKVAVPPAPYQKFYVPLRQSTLRSIATEDGAAVKNSKPKQGKARCFFAKKF